MEDGSPKAIPEKLEKSLSSSPTLDQLSKRVGPTIVPDEGAFEADAFEPSGFQQALALPDKKPGPEPVRTPPPSAGTSLFFSSTQPPQPDPALIRGPTIVQSPLVVTEEASLSVSQSGRRPLRAHTYERVGSPPHKQLALIQLRGLIEACDEAVHFDRTRNIRPPYLWLDDQRYLAELRDILLELRRLNDILEASTSSEPSVLKGADKTASRFGKFMDAYATEMGKGAAQLTKGAIVLGLVYAGVGDAALAKLLGK